MLYQISELKNQRFTQENKKIDKTELFKRRLYSFVLKLIQFIDVLPNNRTTRVLGDQLLRSGTSILANYAEAKSSSSRKDYINFFSYSLKSANESLVWLSLLRDTSNGDKNELEWLLNELEEISKIFASSILTLKGREIFNVHI